MATEKRNSLLCPNCRRLVSRSAPQCPYCGLKRPGSLLKDNPLTRLAAGEGGLLKVLISINVLMYIVSVAFDPRHAGVSGGPFNLLSPSSASLLILGSTGSVPLFDYHRWWSLLTANYLHGGLLHIAFNMIALFQIGPLLIREYGPNRFIIIYTLSGVGGYLLSAVLGVRFTIGASAAVCGLLGAALAYGKIRGGTYGNAVYRQVGGWVLGIFVFGLLVPGINNAAHIGGMLSGALIGYLSGFQERSRETIVHRFLAASCVVLTVGTLAWSVVSGALFLLR